jgi:putative endonuclease
MAQHNKTGERGEDIAVEYLKNNGYKIIEQNWRYGHKEIDIIAEKNNVFVFIEVKTRSSKTFLSPKFTIGKQKVKLLISAANAYLLKKRITKESRFDIITVICEKKYKVAEHLKNAIIP